MNLLFKILEANSRYFGDWLKDSFEYFIPITIAMIVIGVIILVAVAIKPLGLIKFLQLIGGIIVAILFIIGMIAAAVFYFKESPEKDAKTLFWLSIADLIIWAIGGIIYKIRRAKYIVDQVKLGASETESKSKKRKAKKAMKKTDKDFMV